jgi:hypothetical protein
MSNITPINASLPERTTSPELSPRLTQLLGSERSADDAIAEASNCPALIDEARAALPALHRMVEAAGDKVVRDVIGRRFSTYPQASRSDGEWVAWWADYQDALSDQPASAIEAGMREWVRTDTTGFMPKPGQLLALVKVAAEPHWRALSRANRLAKLEPPKPATPESLEARKAMAENVRNLFQPKEA